MVACVLVYGEQMCIKATKMNIFAVGAGCKATNKCIIIHLSLQLNCI